MTKNLHWCHCLADLIDFLAYVAAYAPYDFPNEDEDTLDLETAFLEIDYGVEKSKAEIQNEIALENLRGLIRQALHDYRRDLPKEGARAIVQAQYLLRALPSAKRR